MFSSPSTFLRRTGIQTHIPGHADRYQSGTNHVHGQPLDETIANDEAIQETWPDTSPDKKYLEGEELPI